MNEKEFKSIIDESNRNIRTEMVLEAINSAHVVIGRSKLIQVNDSNMNDLYIKIAGLILQARLIQTTGCSK